jgi:hypothetical protein
MIDIEKRYLKFYDNQILWLVGESSYKKRSFLLLVRNHVKKHQATKNEKTKTSFFLGNFGNSGNRLKNNGLDTVSVTKKLPGYQKVTGLPKHPGYDHK